MKPFLPFSLGATTLLLVVACTENTSIQSKNKQTETQVKVNQTLTSNISSSPDFVRYRNDNKQTSSTTPMGPERLFGLNAINNLKPQELFNTYLPEVESFEVDPCNEVIITTKDNVQLHFEALSFVDAMNVQISDPVQVSVQTFDSNLEFAAAHLTTQTVDGKILETGGMFNITATSKEQEVFLDPNKPFDLAIPIKGNQDMTNMHTYYGQQDGDQIKWVDSQTDKKQPVISKRKKLGQLPRKFFLELVNREFDKANNLLSWSIKETGEKWSDWVQKQDISGTQLESYFKNLNSAITVKIKFGKDGDLIYLYNERKVPKNIAMELAAILESCPNIDYKPIVEKGLDDECELIFYGTDRSNSKSYIEQLVSYYKNGNSDEYMTDVSGSVLDMVVLNVKQLGYINCDHSRGGRDKLHVLFPAVMLYKRVWLIFRDQRVALEGKIKDDEVRFENLPKSNDVYIVALGYDEDGSKMTKLKVNLGEHIEISKMYSFTFDDLEKAFE